MSSDNNKDIFNELFSDSHNEKRYILFGWLVIGIGLVGFLLWAALAPLDRGVASSGEVTVSGNRKVIQAPASGIVRDILIREGQKVKAGEVLLRFDTVEAKGQKESIQEQYITNLAVQQRLIAEQNSAAVIDFTPLRALKLSSPRMNEIITLQQQLFSSRKASLTSELESYKEAIEGLKYQLNGLIASEKNQILQLSSVSEQMNNMRGLAESGYIPRNKYLDMQRQYAQISSIIDETNGHIGQIKKQIIENENRSMQREADYQKDIRAQLAQTQTQVIDNKSKLDSAQLTLANTTITSPVDGYIVGLNIFTQGGVVGAGDHLMDIVPDNAPLIIETRLKVDLIDKVTLGLPVKIMFTAFNQNKTPKIPGEVTMISADRLNDKNNGQPYYQMQVSVTPEGLKMLHADDIKPGMPVEIFVKTGSRSLLNYLFKPIIDRAHTSLTEE